MDLSKNREKIILHRGLNNNYLQEETRRKRIMSLSNHQRCIIDEVNKTSYIQCITDTASELHRIATNISSDIQLVISCIEKDLKHFKDAKNAADKVITVFSSSEENLSTVKDNFLKAYHIWLDEFIETNRNLTNNNCRSNVKNLKSVHDKLVIEIQDSSESDGIAIEDSQESDIEIVNEITYSIPQKNDSGSDKDNKVIRDTNRKESIQRITISESNESNRSIIKTGYHNSNRDTESNCISPALSEHLSKSSAPVTENLNNNCQTFREHTDDNPPIQAFGNYISNESASLRDNNASILVNNENLSSDGYVNIPVNSINLSSNGDARLPVNDINLSSDRKIDSECTVILDRLSQQTIEECKKRHCQTKSKNLLDEEAFTRLIDLDALEKPRNKRRLISSDESSLSSTSNSSLKKERRKPKKFKVVASDFSSFYSSSDEDCKKSINNNDYFEHKDSAENEKLFERYEEIVKQKLLNSDDSTDFEVEENDLNCESYKENSTSKNKKKERKRIIQPNSDSNISSSEDDNRRKCAWSKDKLLRFKLNEKQKIIKTVEKKESDNASDTMLEPIKPIKIKKKKKDLSLSSLFSSWFSSSINTSSSNDSDSDNYEIVKSSSQLSASSGTVNLTNMNNALTPIKPLGRRNIRKVFDDEEVAEGTRRAGKDEENRLQRLAERKKQLQIVLAEKNKEKNTLILDFDLEKKIELLKVDRGLVKLLKPHQSEGVKFMWESCFETLEQVRNSNGSGCILAHCMGLGKTFQVVTLVHTLLVNKNTGIKTVMIVCPMNTILNWVEEFDLWLKHTDNQKKIRVYDLTQLKKTSRRIDQLKFWFDLGGVLVISYDMFRNFTSKEKKLSHQQSQKMKTFLLNPGADLVVCDEGHLLKNETSQIANSMQSVRTKRRIILTGTPLQNNLSEYHCMVQFVKPNLLGTKVEFLNRFGNPIANGQYDNSTVQDVKLMKQRAHVLHRMLEGCVQRCDYAVLTPFLPPKQEYVISLRLSELQIEMYKFFIEKVARVDAKHSKLFTNYNEIKHLIAHPKLFELKYKNSKKSKKSSAVNGTNSSNNIPTEKEYWWSSFVQFGQQFDFTQSYKLIFLYGILERCKREGDKILVFSQSLHTLDLIEMFLKQVDSPPKENGFIDNFINFQDEWKHGLDYFRLDGTVNSEKRNAMCKTFNNSNNTRARLFLISTKAGGLGINLIGANRVIIFDPSWNPSNDLQSIFRIFRFGQSKPCYVYRLLSAGTMEQKIYNRQVTKISLSLRVLDEQQIERHYSDSDLAELYKLEPLDDQPVLNVPRDHVLADVFLKFKKYVYHSFEHDSLLENQEEEELDENERTQAWLEYQQEKLAQIKSKKRVSDKISEPSTSTENPVLPAINPNLAINDVLSGMPNFNFDFD